MTAVYFTDRDLGRRFPEILAAAGLRVERHHDRFADDCPDEEWLAYVGQHGWIAVTHDSKIRYKPNELEAVRSNRVALLVVVGKVPHAELAHSFVATLPKISAFVAMHHPPYIAKVYRPTPAELARRRDASGSIVAWWSE